MIIFHSPRYTSRACRHVRYTWRGSPSVLLANENCTVVSVKREKIALPRTVIFFRSSDLRNWTVSFLKMIQPNIGGPRTAKTTLLYALQYAFLILLYTVQYTLHRTNFDWITVQNYPVKYRRSEDRKKSVRGTVQNKCGIPTPKI